MSVYWVRATEEVFPAASVAVPDTVPLRCGTVLFNGPKLPDADAVVVWVVPSGNVIATRLLASAEPLTCKVPFALSLSDLEGAGGGVVSVVGAGEPPSPPPPPHAVNITTEETHNSCFNLKYETV